jgi:hypothetical protein
MLRVWCVALLTGLLLQAAPPPALQATIRLSVVKVDGPGASATAQPAFGNFGPLLSQLLTPEGPVDIEYTIAGDETRAAVRGRLATLPAASVVLQRLGEDTIKVINPENKTWYEIPASQNLGALLGAPDVTVEPTGEKATIAGRRAERFRFRETLRVPVPEGVSLPPDFPANLDLSGDLWSTDEFAGGNYQSVFKTLQAFAAIPGVEALTANGRFPLRLALRSSIMPGYEIRSEVTAIAPARATPDQFTVPAGYVQVQPPVGGQ